jgi:hypothetical protein
MHVVGLHDGQICYWVGSVLVLVHGLGYGCLSRVFLTAALAGQTVCDADVRDTVVDDNHHVAVKDNCG